MSTGSWDNSGLRPDLSRLPAYIREGMHQPIPVRPDECNAVFVIFPNVQGLNHPNARCNVAPFKKGDENSAISVESGIQIDMNDFTGRTPLASMILDKNKLPGFLTGLLRIYAGLGGDVTALIATTGDSRPEVPAAHIYFEEPRDE